MQEFFQSIGTWFIEQKDAILLSLSTISLPTLIAGVVVTIKQLIAAKNNNKINTALQPSVEANTQSIANAVAVIENLESQNEEMKQQVATAQEQSVKDIAELQSCVDNLLLKINTILDVQALVYQTAKDPQTRETIANLITNAKYAETATRAKIVEELEALKKQAEQAAALTQEQIKTTVTKAKALLEPTEKKAEPEQQVVAPRG